MDNVVSEGCWRRKLPQKEKAAAGGAGCRRRRELPKEEIYMIVGGCQRRGIEWRINSMLTAL
jgi:hypothetical protein